MSSIISDDSRNYATRRKEEGKEIFYLESQPDAVPDFKKVLEPRLAVGSFSICKSTRDMLTRAVEKISSNYPDIAAITPHSILQSSGRGPNRDGIETFPSLSKLCNFCVFLQNDDCEFEMTHSSDIAHGGYNHPLYALVIWKTLPGSNSGRGRSGGGKTQLVGLQDTLYIETTKYYRSGQVAMMECGDIYSPRAHNQFIKNIDPGELSTVDLPLGCLKGYISESEYKTYHNKCLKVESCKRGSLAAFLSRSDEAGDANLKAGVILDLKTKVPSIFYMATCDIPPYTELIARKTLFLPITPPPNNNGPAPRGRAAAGTALDRSHLGRGAKMNINYKGTR